MKKFMMHLNICILSFNKQKVKEPTRTPMKFHHKPQLRNPVLNYCKINLFIEINVGLSMIENQQNYGYVVTTGKSWPNG